MHEPFLRRGRQGAVNLLFLGDSITQGWQGQPAWAAEFAPYTAANFGVPGDQTQQILWRVENGELQGIHPKLVVLLAGTNNLEHDTAEDVASGIRAIVGELERRKPDTTILLLGIFPRGHSPADPLRAKVRAVNRQIEPLGDGRRVHYLDIGERFVAPDGSISSTVMPDYLHLSKDGYDRWASAIRSAVRKLMAH